MAILNKKCGKSHQPVEGYIAWKNALRLFGIEAQTLKFTKDGKLKEFCIEKVWYTIDQFQKFTSFVRDKIMVRKIRKLRKILKQTLPEWVTFKPRVHGLKNHQMGNIHYI